MQRAEISSDLPPIDPSVRKIISDILEKPFDENQAFIDGEDVSLLKYEEIILDHCPIRVYRSNQWASNVQPDDLNANFNRGIDSSFKHAAVYYTTKRGLDEYLPDDIVKALKEKWESYKKTTPELNLSEEEKNRLFDRRLESPENLKKYERYQETIGAVLKEFAIYKNQLIEAHNKISEHIIAFNHPLLISETDYSLNTFNREKYGIKDIRYITPEEIERLKSQGYDGINIFSIRLVHKVLKKYLFRRP